MNIVIGEIIEDSFSFMRREKYIINSLSRQFSLSLDNFKQRQQALYFMILRRIGSSSI